jgi:hypothetical protein
MSSGRGFYKERVLLNNTKLNVSERTIIGTEASMIENSFFFGFFLDNKKKNDKKKKNDLKKTDLKKMVHYSCNPFHNFSVVCFQSYLTITSLYLYLFVPLGEKEYEVEMSFLHLIDLLYRRCFAAYFSYRLLSY